MPRKHPIKEREESTEPYVSPCDAIPDKVCGERKDCRLPDGSFCPAFGDPKLGRRA